MSRARRGFTLIELLIVVVIIGILAAIVVAKFTSVRQRSYVASMESDLRLLSIQEELYFGRRQGYTTALDSLPVQSTTGVTLQITNASVSGWAAIATHASATGAQCGIFVGAAPAATATPATNAGEIACTY